MHAKKTNQSYSELLKDPRWQKKRLQIMERDKFMCRECGDTESTLNVHHLFYNPHNLPWEYDESELKTLCESCHKGMHEDYESIKRITGTFNCEVLHYAVEILSEMQYLYPPDCQDLFDLATELAKINKNE